jgi:putative membrane protein
MRVDRFLREEDLAAIEAAVREAETASGGEIVPYLADASDAYPGAPWTAAALGAVVAPALAATAYALAGLWGSWWPLWMTAPPVAGAAAGYLAASFLAPLRRWVVPASVRARRVEQRAAAAFLAEEVFATRDRTGILLFVSLFERRVVVLADSGIHGRVSPGVWDDVVSGPVAGLHAGKPGPALAEAVRRCGAILAEHGLPLRADDRDELANRLRREDR